MHAQVGALCNSVSGSIGPYVTLNFDNNTDVTATSCGGPIDVVPCTNGIPPVARGGQAPLLEQLVG